jgi:endogenous inhibitor of DNA gyrase (YacG/DUF329 family)
MTASRKAKRCPVCGKPATPAHRPFCSQGCANVDLNRWLSGAYRIPAREETPGRGAEDDPDTGDEQH